jgi:transcriptional regulator with XRE-family HTH domain
MAAQYTFCTTRLLEVAQKVGDTTGYAIAQRAGISGSVVSRILNGRRRPSLETAVTLARTYGVQVDDLIREAA